MFLKKKNSKELRDKNNNFNGIGVRECCYLIKVLEIKKFNLSISL